MQAARNISNLWHGSIKKKAKLHETTVHLCCFFFLQERKRRKRKSKKQEKRKKKVYCKKIQKMVAMLTEVMTPRTTGENSACGQACREILWSMPCPVSSSHYLFVLGNIYWSSRNSNIFTFNFVWGLFVCFLIFFPLL